MARTLLALWAFCCFSGFWVNPAWGQSEPTPEPEPPVQAALLAETSAVTPGQPFTAGLHLRLAPGWHTYWSNPGDSGLPVEIQWKLPPDWKAGAIQWPIPERQIEPGDMVTYGYKEEVLLLIELTPPADVPPGPITLEASASWLACDKSCVPGKADLSLPLVVAESSQSPPSTNAELFTRFRVQLPKTTPLPFTVRWEPHDTETYLKVGKPPGANSVKFDFFPLLALPGHLEQVTPGVFRIPLPKESGPDAPPVQGLLILERDGLREGWLIDNRPKTPLAPTESASPFAIFKPESRPPVTDAHRASLSLPEALGLGFLGGFILNLMPCVLPVIALKIFGFLGQAGQSRQRVFRMGLSFVGGIFAWFLALAALVVIARAVGREVTWAFQFQNPLFVLGMMTLVFVFALNLLGVFEIWLPGGGTVAALTEKEGYAGSFLHGVFATLLATPCTAPFLGPALAFAFAQSAGVTFGMFTAIAAGMSAPYLLLAARPGWMRFLPKPGIWMVRLKQLMGFLLLGTVVWLLGVLGSQLGVSGVVRAAWLLLGFGAACWIFGTWMVPGAPWLQRFLALLAMATVIALPAQLTRPAPAEAALMEWQPWSAERVAVLQKEGKPVFVDFTADWCLNCKYNEQWVLNTPPVRAALSRFALLKADWTRGDPLITAELKRLGRAAVPVYAIYPAGGGKPQVLSELLTQRTVLEALNPR